MTSSLIALVVSGLSALASVLGMLVAVAALRLSAASVPLEFRLHLDEEAGTRPRPGPYLNWVTGRLINAGPSHKVASLTVTDWRSDLRNLSAEQLPIVATKGHVETYPDPQRWGKFRRRWLPSWERYEAGIFSPKTLRTGQEIRVEVRMPSHVEKLELSVGVTNLFASSRAYRMWVTNPLFDSGRKEY